MIALAKAAGKAPLYIVHVSAKESVNLIREARKAGDTVFGETCPQYLVLDESRYDDPVEGLKFILSPPLRTKEHQAGNQRWDVAGDCNRPLQLRFPWR